MTPFSWHKRNHSFPPSLKYVQKSTKVLGPPLPDIDDEPFMHFLSSPDEEEEYADYLHFDAGILAGSEASKHKIQKFKPHDTSDSIRHHHGLTFPRRTEHHGWVQAASPSHDTRVSHFGQLEHRDTTPSRPARRSRRTLSGHRHSWREPSPDIFTLDEELPQIVVSDFDAGADEQSMSASIDASIISADTIDKDAEVAADSDDATQSPRLNASSPSTKPDVELNQMWFAEKARL